MSKRVMVGLMVTIGLVTMGLIGLWWTADAEAATCLQYRTVGGSSVCSKWSTKGVLVELEYKQPCGPPDGEGGGGENCSAVAEAVSTNSIAFCENPSSPSGVSKVTCNDTVTFFGSETGCEERHEKDGTTPPGSGHDKGKHGCKATFVLQQVAGACAAQCTAAGFGPPLDVTPITMTTNVAVTVMPEGEGSGPNSACTYPGYYTSSCTFTESCSINPSKIEFNAIRAYQCKLTSAGGPPPEPPCEVCD